MSNICGKTYNYITIIKDLGGGRVRSKCICGKISIRDKWGVINLRYNSCGCVRRKEKKEKIEKAMIGKKFGKWTVLSFDSLRNMRYMWRCQCECGTIKSVPNQILKKGESKSCGCLKGTSMDTGETSFNSLYYNYRRSALKRHLSFEISKEEFNKITSSNCRYCGNEPSRIISKTHSKKPVVIKHTQYTYNGIDRVNPNIGYIKGNIVACCWLCNVAKNNMPLEEFSSWVANVINHNVQEVDNIKDIILKENPLNNFTRSIVTPYKRHAKNLGLPFNLSLLQAYAIMEIPCFYCGQEPSNFYRGCTYSGIDRIDSKKGYIVDNVVPCCKRCNIAKASMSIDGFKKHIQKIYLNMIVAPGDF